MGKEGGAEAKGGIEPVMPLKSFEAVREGKGEIRSARKGRGERRTYVRRELWETGNGKLDTGS